MGSAGLGPFSTFIFWTFAEVGVIVWRAIVLRRSILFKKKTSLQGETLFLGKLGVWTRV